MKALALVLAVFFFIVAILYAAGAIQFFVSHPGGRHITHAVLFAAIGVLCLIWMRFQTSGRSSARLR